MKYSFEWSNQGAKHWVRSKQEFNTVDEAATEASSWMVVNFINDYIVSVRLVKVS